MATNLKGDNVMATTDIDVQKFLVAVGDEVERARKLFPTGANKTLAAATEEIGEVANALIENELGKDTVAHIYKECIQLAAMATRIAIDGDGSFNRQNI